MNKKDITCDLLREKHGALSQQRETCSRLLVTNGPLSGEFIDAFRAFEERRKELKTLLKEYRWGWMEGLPTIEITRECDSVDEYREKLKEGGITSMTTPTPCLTLLQYGKQTRSVSPSWR